MFVSLIAAILILLALMLAWIEVQRMARVVADQHPEAGPLRLVGGGCGGQGHGDKGHGDAPAPRKPVPAKTPEGCASCSNTSCKPAEIQPLPH
jgi:hypothetical protein